MSSFQHINSACDLELLRVDLERFLPTSTQVLNILKLKLQNRFTTETSVEFYILGDKNQTKRDLADPFLVIVQKPNIWTLNGIFIHAPENPTKEMLAELESIIDWDKDLRFCCINQDFVDRFLKRLCEKRGLTLNSENDIPCVSNMCNPELAMSFRQEDEEVVLRPLEIKDIEQILRNYPYKTPHSGRQIELCIENLTSCGLYVDGVLASWAILASSGLINILHTEEAYIRRGYGLLVIKALAKQIAHMGLTPLIETELYNETSKAVQRKAGFQLASYTNWILFK